ncbi:MAG: hypothetical protein MUF38_17045 [Anaerolineae bacterium]|jgi:hypothetical protein|nr:hypothetical protein [Anaerolineae bacterium]
MNDRIRQIAVLITAALDIVSSFWLGDSLDQTGADSTPVYFLPFGLTFAIWGVIFASQMVYAVYQALPNQTTRAIHRRIGGWVALNAGLTALWNLCAGLAGQEGTPGFQPLLVVATVFIVVGMLYALTQVFIILRTMHDQLTPRDRWLAQFPTTVFFAWLNVATIANTTAALDALGLTGSPTDSLWAVAMLAVTVVLATLMVHYTRAALATITYTSVIVWGAVGIVFNNLDQSPLVAASAGAAAVAVAVVAALHYGSTLRMQANPTIR